MMHGLTNLKNRKNICHYFDLLMSVFVTSFNRLTHTKPESLFLSVYVSDVPYDGLLLLKHVAVDVIYRRYPLAWCAV